ncbi:MAG: hypothetical protein A3C02_00875 [Candidatus Andersenbacteria bacterium RIFCSPHIGHO2_02_FULL_45_11]|uniref:DUF5667 domain-containing protein n=1 Tax=Candidatus Andersenbacteria bacterium RIFCSPHIGHO2_12_FULL_45_11 TaxID=1797281 RepID=A0A1G1X540_9BACT|nr:MAG: hypothetical protein A2805_01545 [Candidatus Andersenbacteria bacterium RIFCSPHIGHO2_01_FULL_46_36]OGY33336.1 MAG: hypothetical protein A3C02_00875 [Candidatus Andersenbacteria bacterium RIFCSPHIGHO2_02_FULL_45_11]OGY34690.1 MAG: hypothetical protein A3D99_05125 [Candidatus Andersenbacteria bacterium RIFCSPHIGHO2_12_FULL_45_11]
MIKLVLFLIIALTVIGVFTGAIKIQLDNEKLSELPKTVGQFVTNQSVASNASYYFTTWKRKAELAIAGSAEKKFELDMKYVEADTAKLKAAIDANTNPADIIMKTKLLNEGIARAKQGVEEISDEAIARLRDSWLKILAAGDLELQRLGGLADEYKKFQEELTKLAPPTTPTATPVPLKF